MTENSIVLKIFRVVFFICFAFFYLLSATWLGVIPYIFNFYQNGEYLGCGAVLWYHYVQPPFVFTMVIVLVLFAITVFKDTRIKPFVAMLAGAGLLFLINWLVPLFVLNSDEVAYLEVWNAPTWMRLLYVVMPLFYVGVSYFVFPSKRKRHTK